MKPRNRRCGIAIVCLLAMISVSAQENAEPLKADAKTEDSAEVTEGAGVATEAQDGKNPEVTEEVLSAEEALEDREELVEAEAETGTLTITTEPPEAVVILDKEEKGKTPLTLEGVAAGVHVVELRKTGHFLKRAKIKALADTTLEYEFKLLAPACLTINSDPPGAAVVLDKKSVGSTPIEKCKLKPGDHTVALSLAGYETVEKTVALASGGKDTLTVSLGKIASSADSAEDTEKAPEEDPEEKSTKSLVIRIVVLSVFVLFGVGILVAELAGP